VLKPVQITGDRRSVRGLFLSFLVEPLSVDGTIYNLFILNPSHLATESRSFRFCVKVF